MKISNEKIFWNIWDLLVEEGIRPLRHDSLAEAVAELAQKENQPAWKPASETPDTEIGKWSEEFIVITNLGNVFKLRFFNGSHDKIWQCSEAFEKDEQIEYWTENLFSE
jgi:hypothetical protein